MFLVIAERGESNIDICNSEELLCHTKHWSVSVTGIKVFPERRWELNVSCHCVFNDGELVQGREKESASSEIMSLIFDFFGPISFFSAQEALSLRLPRKQQTNSRQ